MKKLLLSAILFSTFIGTASAYTYGISTSELKNYFKCKDSSAELKIKDNKITCETKECTNFRTKTADPVGK